MTVVFGLVSGGKVHLTADSISADDRGIYGVAAVPKIVRIPGPAGMGPCPSLLFGFTSSWRFGQVAEQALVAAGWKAPRFDDGDRAGAAQVEAGERGMPWPRSRAAEWREDDPEGRDYVRRWLVGWMVPALQKALKEAAWSEVKDNVQKGGFALLGIAGRLFRVQQDFSVVEHANGYDAVGAGEEVAIGALAATDGLPLEVWKRIAAVSAAVERHSVWVRGPWRTETA